MGEKLIKYKYTLTYSVSIITVVLVSFFVYIYSTRENPILLYNNFNNDVFDVVPQGWAFFTRDPREPQVIIYEIKNNKIINMEHRHSSYKRIFGLERDYGKLISELQVILSNVKKAEFENYHWNYQSEINNTYIPKKIHYCKNKYNNPLLTKEYLVVFQKAIPWAWLNSIDKIKMEAKIIRIKINS